MSFHKLLETYKEKGQFEPFEQKKVASNCCSGATAAMLQRLRYLSKPKLSDIPPGEMKDLQAKAHKESLEDPIDQIHTLAGYKVPTKKALVKPSDIAEHLEGKSTAAIQITLSEDGEVKGEHAVAFGKVKGKGTFSDSRIGTFHSDQYKTALAFVKDWANIYAAPNTNLVVVTTEDPKNDTACVK